MSQSAGHFPRQFGVVSYRPGRILPIHQLDSVVNFWK
jgi:hypothetical protein